MRTIERHHLLRRCDVGVAGANDFVDTRNGIGAIGKGGNRLRAADAVKTFDAEHCRRRQSLRRGAGRRHRNALDPRDLRGNHRHQHRRGQRIAPAGNIAANRCDRLHPLSHAHARIHGPHPRPRHLPLGKAADVARRPLDGVHELGRNLTPRGFQFLATDPHGLLFAETVQLPRILSQGFVAVGANLANDLRDRPLHRGRNGRAAAMSFSVT